MARGLERAPRWAVVSIAVAAVIVAVLAWHTISRDQALQTPQSVIDAAERSEEAAQAERDVELPGVAFLGDSYTVGARATSPALRWSRLFCADLGCRELNFGISDTGYAVVGDQPDGNLYRDRIAEIAAATPSLVVVSGGRNDFGTPVAEVRDAVDVTFQNLRAALPNTPIVAFSPFWGDDEPVPTRVSLMGEQIRDAVASVGGTYVDVGLPLTGRPDLMDEDNVHPNDAGYQELASAVMAAWRAAGLPDPVSG